ncbi:MAG TPA: hypothetical protein VIV60_27950, partial [Polyangiaceae bacterium]
VMRIGKLRTAAVADPDNRRMPNVYFDATAEAVEQPAKYAAKKGKSPKRANVASNSKLTALYPPSIEIGL